jgi:hypothetical protein
MPGLGRGPPRPGSLVRGAPGRGGASSWPGTPGRACCGRTAGEPEPTPKGLLPIRGVRGPGLGACGRGGTTAVSLGGGICTGRTGAADGELNGSRVGALAAGSATDGAAAAGSCGAGACSAGATEVAAAAPLLAGAVSSCAAATDGVVTAPLSGTPLSGAPLSGAPLSGAPLADVVAGRAAVLRRAGAEAAPAASAGNASRSLRATGASTVEDGDFTNSPMSLSLSSTCLLVTPSSFASSCTRALPATALPAPGGRRHTRSTSF